MVLLKKAGTLLISIVAMLCRIMTKIALSKLFLHDFFIFFLVIAMVYYDLELCPGSMQIYLRQKISKKYHTGIVIYHFSKCIDWSASPCTKVCLPDRLKGHVPGRRFCLVLRLGLCLVRQGVLGEAEAGRATVVGTGLAGLAGKQETMIR